MSAIRPAPAMQHGKFSADAAPNLPPASAFTLVRHGLMPTPTPTRPISEGAGPPKQRPTTARANARAKSPKASASATVRAIAINIRPRASPYARLAQLLAPAPIASPIPSRPGEPICTRAHWLGHEPTRRARRAPLLRACPTAPAPSSYVGRASISPRTNRQRQRQRAGPGEHAASALLAEDGTHRRPRVRTP